MGSDDNRVREKWQDYSAKNAGQAEKNFFDVFDEIFKKKVYKIRSKPAEFNKIYVDYKLSDQVISEIYNPKKAIIKHGVFPDFAIDNTETKKTIYVEVKRQDGWVEGGVRSDGRGNAHERSCKFFTPGLLKILREKGGISEPALPFWTVFQGNITRDPCRVREITCWYQGHTANFFFWRDTSNSQDLFNHFSDNIAPLID